MNEAPKAIKPERSKAQERVPDKKSIFLLIFLSIITLGIYPAFWYIRRAPEFNDLHTTKKLNPSIGILYLVGHLIFLTSIALYITNMLYKFTTITDFDLIAITTAISLIGIILIIKIILAFKTKNLINEALKNKGVERKLSGFFTLIFNQYYLQYEINRIMKNTEDSKRIGPWVLLLLILAGIGAAGYYIYISNIIIL